MGVNLNLDLSNRNILITGGTGTMGSALVNFFLHMSKETAPSRIVVYSRDEFKQLNLRLKYEASPLLDRLRFFIGDIRDQSRMELALDGIDIVIHCAALKQVDTCEYNPFEAIQTNILGTQKLIAACLAVKSIRKVVALSTDKASSPINLYGATKLCADKLVSAANAYVGERDLKLCVVRYGNVEGSRGSVIPLFLEKMKHGKIQVTDPTMTRFTISVEQAIQSILRALHCLGGEVFIPKIESFRLSDLANSFKDHCEIEIIGPRVGEKLHEEMISEPDMKCVIEDDRFFILCPSATKYRIEDYLNFHKGTNLTGRVQRYSSELNGDFLSQERLKLLIETVKQSS